MNKPIKAHHVRGKVPRGTFAVEPIESLRDIEKRCGLPFAAFKTTNDSRGIKGNYRHLPADDAYGLLFYEKVGRSYKALSYGHNEPILVLDTKSYSGGKRYPWQFVLHWRKLDSMGLDMWEDRELAPAEAKEEYIRTRAYYLYLEDEKYGWSNGSLMNWIEAEEWINKHYVFVVRRTLEVYG
jgi:hypothetical protein